MKRLILIAVAAIPLLLLAQVDRDLEPQITSKPVRLPNGKLQSDEILKIEHKKSLQDVDALIETAEELREELLKNDRFVLSIASMKKTEEIEKLARKIRDRMKH